MAELQVTTKRRAAHKEQPRICVERKINICYVETLRFLDYLLYQLPFITLININPQTSESVLYCCCPIFDNNSD